MNRDLRLRPDAAGEKGEEARNGCEEDIATRGFPELLAKASFVIYSYWPRSLRYIQL